MHMSMNRGKITISHDDRNDDYCTGCQNITHCQQLSAIHHPHPDHHIPLQLILSQFARNEDTF